VSFNCPKFIEEFKNYVDKLEAKTILEVGAKSGELMDAVGGAGIDINPMRDDVKKCDIRKYRGKKHELAFSSGMIEHYTKEDAIKVLKAIAKASSKYVLTYVPNSNCKAYMNAKTKTKAEWGNELDYTAETLAGLHEEIGLTVVDSGVAGTEWAKRFGAEPSEGYLVYCLAKK